MYGFGGVAFGGIEGSLISGNGSNDNASGVFESVGSGDDGIAGVTVGVRETYPDESVEVG
ncbi:hypothetical protein AGMMS49936_03810 [Endomicrobiia bacterium]|nr:hypothetical protein AGMMS49936_03810 [Endomicrobiia bacterium]